MSLKFYDTPPYYDDFDKTKNYQRILFRPGYSVQARELTQMQTALQAQIDRFGSHVFKDGSQVIGGTAALDSEFAYVKLESSFTHSSGGSTPPNGTYTPDNYANLATPGIIVTGVTTGITATVQSIAPVAGADPLTMFVKYNKSGTDTVVQVFAPGEYISFLDANTVTRYFKVKPTVSLVLPTGYGCQVSVNEGVFFIAGNFVYTAGESIILAKYEAYPSARVVYKVTENIITSADDSTLTDNALGSPNAAAPGAHRYQIALDLAIEPIELADRVENNIIQLLVVRDGMVSMTARTSYSELGDILAQRTFEESGNYAVRPFQVNVREYLNTGTNGGLYTTAQIIAAGDAVDGGTATTFGSSKLAIGLEPSVAYVNGYRIEIEDTKYVASDKARELGYFNAASVLGALGNYIYINTLVSLPDVNEFGQMTLKKAGAVSIGTARARSIEYVSGTAGAAAAVYKLYLFDIKITGGEVWSALETITHSHGFGAAFSCKVGTSTGAFDPTLYDTSNNSLLFKLPVTGTSTLRATGGLIDTLYYVKKKYDNRTTDGAGVVTITATTDEIFDTTTDWVGVRGDTGAHVAPATTVIGGGGTTITFTFTGLVTIAMYIVGPSRRNIREKIKNYVAAATLTINTGTYNVTPGNYDSLAKTDVTSIVSVMNGAVNITDRYILDNGQRDNFYDVARIQLRSDAAAPTGASIVITFNHFTHQPGDYFSVDSYTGQVAYGDIPSFHSSRGLIELRDAVDFRPTIASAGTVFTGAGSSVVSMVKPNSIFTSDIQYYLPRIDKVYVDKKGNFGVLQGISSLSPVPPEDPKDAMILYVMRMGAYTFGASDALPTMIDNKRYTMRDIGKIEKRVSKLEYYTSLSLLEKDTAGAQIFDGSNNVRYKNGFVVDSFYGSNVGAVTHPDYRASTDKAAGKLRATFTSDNVRLQYDSGSSSDLRKTGPLLTLNYYQSEYLRQPYASYAEFVNPYNVFSWVGAVKLSPEMDEWKETARRPEVIIDQSGIYDSLRFLADEAAAQGTVWNEWQTNWTGVVGQDSNTEVNNDWSSFQQTSITTLATTTQVNQSRSGIRTTVVPDTVTTNVGDRTVEVNFVPFIRARKIYFNATRLKPNTRVYAFFDNADVSSYVRQEAFVAFSDATDVVNYLNATVHPSGATNLVTDAAGAVEGSFIIPNTSSLKFKTGSRIFRLTDSATNADDAVTSAESVYNAAGLLETRENLIISTRVPRIERSQLSDSRVVTDTAQSSTSVVTSLQPPPITPPVEPELPAEETIAADVVVWTDADWADRFQPVRWVDPLAQTFLADMQGGVFATSIDLFFQAKDANIPVTLQIRTVENGIPTQRVVPFSQVTLEAADISISADGSAGTTFTFEAPVHLIQGVEYCFVIMSNSDAHKVWVSELGGYDVTTPAYRITKQPYNGVMFKSQNASTWTPEQSKDIKFVLRRAVFNDTGIAVFNEIDLPTRYLGTDPIYTDGTTSVRILHKNHGHFAGTSKVTLSGIVANAGANVNGVPIVQLNTTLTVQTCEQDSYTVVVATTASSTGRAGGTTVYATENRVMNVCQPIIQQTIVPDTDLQWSAKFTTGKSLAGTETPHTVSAYTKIKVNDNSFLTRPAAVVSQPNYTLLSAGTKSFILRGDLVTARNNISPVIDLDRLSLITVANRIDNPSAGASSGYNQVFNYIPETTAVGGSILAKYITRKVELNDPAAALKIYILLNRPSGTNVTVYYKVQTAGTDTSFDTIAWILAAPDTAIPTSDNLQEYTEAQYSITEAQLSNLEFTAFAVKVCFTSENSSSIPTCRDFRAIAVT